MTKRSWSYFKSLFSFESLLYFFIMCPFLFPTTLLETNLQPYAMIISFFYILFHFREFSEIKLSFSMIILFFVFIGAWCVVFLNPFDGTALRGLSNYLSIYLIPMATYLMLVKNDGINERKIKNIILLWFFVGFIQLFFKRDFLTPLIGGARWSTSYRGATGLASEPSFYGIASFFFLFLTKRFKKDKWTYYVLILVMGILFAQSAMGVIFIVSFVLLDLLDEVRKPKGHKVLIGFIVTFVAIYIIVKHFYSDSRLYILVSSLIESGFGSLRSDESAAVRLRSMIRPALNALDHYLMPQGFSNRIGSGFGAILNEFGVLGIGLLFIIPFELSKVFSFKLTRRASFLVIFILLFSNTQLANPIMSFVIGINMFYGAKTEDRLPVASQ